jgi:hypothetical protein
MLTSATYEFTVLPMHVAKIAVGHLLYERYTHQPGHWHPVLADPYTEVKLCFCKCQTSFKMSPSLPR